MSNRKNQYMKKVIIFGMVGLMFFSTLAGLISAIQTPSSSNTYDEDIEKALKIAVEVEDNVIDKIVEKQTKEKDYSLKTVLDFMKTNPAYIAKDNVVTYKKEKIDKKIENYMNKKYQKDDFIELAWKTKDNYLITTYLASDIKDDVNVVGLFIDDLSITKTSNVENTVNKTNKKFEDIADLNLTLKQIEEKIGEMDIYYTQYPLLDNSEIVKNHLSESYSKYIISKRMIRTENSTIIVYTKDDSVLSTYEVLDNYDSLVKVNKKLFSKITNTENLKEDDFLKKVKKAKLVVKEIIEENNKDVLKTVYLIKNNEDSVYLVKFEEGVKSSIEELK